MTGRQMIHMCVDICGAIHNLQASRAKGSGGYRHDDGRPMTRLEAIDALLDELAKGRRVLPMGECPTFDYQTGCPGHPMPEEAPREMPR